MIKYLIQNPVVVSAIVSLLGTVVIVIVNFIMNFINNKKQRNAIEKQIKNEVQNLNIKHSLEYVTNNRVEWTYKVRDYVAQFIAKAQSIANDYKIKNIAVPNNYYYDLNIEIAKLKLFFNINGDLDKAIIKIADTICNNLSSDTFSSLLHQDDIALLTNYCQVYFKLEWERVKIEVESPKTKSEVDDILRNKRKDLFETLYNDAMEKKQNVEEKDVKEHLRNDRVLYELQRWAREVCQR